MTHNQTNPTNEQELREAIINIVEAEYKKPNYIPVVERVEHLMQLIIADRERVALDKEEMTLRYAIQTLQDTNKEFALENLQRQLDKNLAQQEEV